MSWSDIEITWLGHATFFFETADGQSVLVDPWLEDNPSCPEEYEDLDPDGVLVTHGHPDHVGNLTDVADRTSGPIVGIFEVATWLEQQGYDPDRLVGMNKGGSVAVDELDIEVTMTDAKHSSSFPTDDDLVYLGEPAGYVVDFSGGESVYIAGDTCLFGDMEWIGRLHDPDLAILPIGDRFTMDPKAAAHACDLLDVEAAIPCHWGTFPPLTGTPEEFRSAVEQYATGTDVVTLEAGESM